MTGWLNFNGTIGPEWTTSDGTRFAVRPYVPGNLFQITIKPSGDTEVGALNISNQGDITLAKALPIAQGGTGATDAGTARGNLGITPANIGALSMTLLWSNSKPTSTFAAQTISVSLSSYKMCCIVYDGNINYSHMLVAFVPVGNKTWLQTEWNFRLVREATANTTSVVFGKGYGGELNTSVYEYSQACVPVKIYGVGGVSA